VAELLRLGDAGAAVVEVRAHLAQLGRIDDSSSDVFDETVDRAVRAFQQDRGMPVDGIVGPNTLRRLDEARWQLGDRVLQFSPGHLMRGDDVATLQRRLNELGFDAGRADGIFGRQTDAALREFQRGVGATVDGLCGPQTFKAFDRLIRTVNGGDAAILRDHVALTALQTGIAGKTIVVDAGTDIAPEICHAVAVRVEGRLAALGTTVLLTRGASTNVALAADRDRASFANRTGADLVLSIHLNESDSPHPQGIACFYYGDPSGAGAHSSAGRNLAALIQEELVRKTRAVDCQVHPRTWDLLRMTRMPAVRIELGSISNPDDRARLADRGKQDVAAEAIAIAVSRFCRPWTGR
jgi:N-acetylmuramoyl-L-alanine amidase